MIPGTENAGSPIWSPDGRYLAFIAEGKLEKIGLEGGDVEAICAAPDMRGATWSENGKIVFAPSSDGPLFQVPAAGGTPVAVTTLDSTRFETAHRFPTFLPDGRHFVFVALPPRLGRYTILVGSVDGMKPKKIVEADGGAIYAAPGWLVYAHSARLMAQRFDVRGLKLVGQPLALGDSPDRGNIWGCPGVSASQSGDGVLAYVPWTPPNNELAWFSLDGRLLAKIPVAPGPYGSAVPSPDGLQFVAERQVTQDRTEIWQLDGVRGIATRLVDVPGSNVNPLWSPDGRSVMYTANRRGPSAFYVIDASGAGAEKLVYESPSAVTNLASWPASHDGVLFQQTDPVTAADLWWLPLHGDRKPVPIARTRAVEGNVAEVSPDGEWLLYDSDATGRNELYARPFAGGPAVQVTTAGSAWGCWRRSGQEILSVGPDGRSVTALPFEPGSAPRVGAARNLFVAPEGISSVRYDRSGDRFLILRSVRRPEDSNVTVLLNWTAALMKP
jgi:Tol biopolymer transport system component